MHPTDAVQWLARAPGPGRSRWKNRSVAKLLDGFYEAGIAAEAWRTDLFPELESGPGRFTGRLLERRFPDRGPARRADALGSLGPHRADLRRPDLRRG